MLFFQKKKIELANMPLHESLATLDKLGLWFFKKNFEAIEKELTKEIFLGLSLKARMHLMKLGSMNYNFFSKMSLEDFILAFFHTPPVYRPKFLSVLPPAIQKEITSLHQRIVEMYGKEIEMPIFFPLYWDTNEAVKFIKSNPWKEVFQSRAIVVSCKQEFLGTISTLNLLLHPSNKKLKNVKNQKKIQVEKVLTNTSEILKKTASYSGGFVVFVDEQQRILFAAKRTDLQKIENLKHSVVISRTLGLDLSLHKLELIVVKRALGISFNMITAVLFICINIKLNNIIKPNIAVLYPVITGLSGAFGTQTIARTLIHSDYEDRNKILKFFTLEIVTGLLTAFFYSLIIYCIISLTTGSNDALILSITLLCNMTWASSLGCLLPFLSKHFGIDPALCSGPLLTASTDVIGFLLSILFCYVF